MLQSTQPRDWGAWARTALVVGLAGALLGYLIFAVVQFILTGSSEGRMMSGGNAFLTFLLVTLVLLGGGGWWLLRAQVMAPGLIILLGVGWLGAYVCAWIVGGTMQGMPLLVYLLIWAAYGGLMSWYAPQFARLPDRPGVGTPPQPPVTRVASTVQRTSQYGRIPPGTVTLVTRLVRQVDQATVVLPAGVPRGIRDFTIKATLDRMLRDWWENGNREGLAPRDVGDLNSFVKLAVALAAPYATGDRPLHSEVSQAIYRATLTALLDDWLFNWNADGVDGPPRR